MVKHLMVGMVVLLSLSLYGKDHTVIQHAPLPASVLSAKTIFIQNDSGSADAADKAYTGLKNWGRYQIVESREKADLVLVVSESKEQTQSDSSGAVSLYNYQTGAWTQGTVPSVSVMTWRFTELKLVDRAGNVAWSDKMVQRKKYSACLELLKSLQKRVDSQIVVNR